jgi:hypothetical protein
MFKLHEVIAFARMHAAVSRLHDENIGITHPARSGGLRRINPIVTILNANTGNGRSDALHTDSRSIGGIGNPLVILDRDAVKAGAIRACT